jgi:putative tryptophan/tyrosine transport system substrate-binding protein
VAARGARAAGGDALIGLIEGSPAENSVKRLEAFRKGLRKTGYLEGRNVAIEFRWAGGNYVTSPPSEIPRDLADFQS